MDTNLSMLSLEAMASRNFTPKEWLTYYRNIWVRNATSRTVDVVNDQALKKIDPEQLVPHVIDNQEVNIPVKQRLEFRKLAVQDALDIIAGMDLLLTEDASDEAKFAAKYWTKDALKVDEDMLPPPTPAPVEGGVCQLDDGSGEGVYGMIEGNLVCVKKPEAPATPPAPAPEAINTDAPKTEAGAEAPKA